MPRYTPQKKPNLLYSPPPPRLLNENKQSNKQKLPFYVPSTEREFLNACYEEQARLPECLAFLLLAKKKKREEKRTKKDERKWEGKGREGR